LGDELDSPRGRIYLIKDMLENNRIPDARTVKHIDRCLSCLACMTTCPSGVHYMHLIDHARAYINDHYKRPWHDRALRWVLAQVIPYPTRFRLALLGAKIARPFVRFVPDARLRAMISMAPKQVPPVSRNDDPQSFAPIAPKKKRVALMTGCAQRALNTDINDATIRVLRRFGCEVVIPKDQGCCGALTHHMGKVDASHASAEANIRAWMAEINGEGLDAIVINTSGCGTTVKDYGHMFRDTPLAQEAATISALAKDISEVLVDLDLPKGDDKDMTIAYHAACSLQHGQKIKDHPKTLLKHAGFRVAEPRDPHLCCGSAGTYNLLQPEISGQLKDRKVKTLEAVNPDIIAAGNIGCMMQIGSATSVPIVHTVELIDWATGGPKPAALAQSADRSDPIPKLR
jgi:glycolate oxidase iron-sulfur subunit